MAQVFFGGQGSAKPTGKSATALAQGTHLFLWLPHFHDFCLTVGVIGCGINVRCYSYDAS